MNKKPDHGLRTWLEISVSAFRHNYQVFRTLAPNQQLMAVVKSNAYGHDLIPAARVFSELGADWLGVDSLIEAIALREQKITTPILVLGYTLPENFALAAEQDITLTISSWPNLKLLTQHSVKWHLKLDTGMHRQGFLSSELPAVLAWLAQNPLPAKNLTGVYTHFAAAKNPAFPIATQEQNRQFEAALGQIQHLGLKPLAHAAATAGTIIFPNTHHDLVRIGIGLYGLWPAAETRAAFVERFSLQPTLTWKTIIGEIKKLPAGSRVGYDLTETLPHGATLAVCPVGYWHGYPRLLSSTGHVLVRGERAKIIGRISMDMISVNVSKITDATVGDEVVLIGQQENDEVNADELATLSQTTNYEIITRLNPLMKRVYI